jgi:hypothetical protein
MRLLSLRCSAGIANLTSGRPTCESERVILSLTQMGVRCEARHGRWECDVGWARLSHHFAQVAAVCSLSPPDWSISPLEYDPSSLGETIGQGPIPLYRLSWPSALGGANNQAIGRMTLFHMSIAFLTIGFGAEIARLLASRLDFVPEGVLTLICIIASSFLIWPIYRLFRLMLPLPGCPNGHGVHWARTANQGQFPAWS